MILFVNTQITQENTYAAMPAYSRGNLPSYNKVDILLYTLASYATIPWTQVIIQIGLDEEYKNLEERVENEIKILYKNHNLVYNKHRTALIEEWKEVYNTYFKDLPDNQSIFYAGNNDHVFIANNLDMLTNCEQELVNSTDELCSVMYSHFPEVLKFCAMNIIPCNIEHGKLYKPGILKGTSRLTDAIQIVNKALMHYWIFIRSNAFPDKDKQFMPRMDWGPPPMSNSSIEHIVFISLTELCRHFDGYSHVGIIPDNCPPLHIPEGFFENKIKIRYGYEDTNPEWVNIHPGKPHRSVVENGIDLCGTLEDIPLFWKDKIVEIDENPTVSRDGFIELRNKVHTNLARAIDPNIPEEWITQGYIYK